MRNKKIFLFISVIIIVFALIAIMLSFVSKSKNVEGVTTMQRIYSTAQSTANTGATAVSTSHGAQPDPPPSTADLQSKSKSDIKPFYQSGWWYYFDDESIVCYAFSFDDDNNVNIAMFDSSNIIGEDPQYFEGYSTYTASSSAINVKAIKSNNAEKFEDIKIEDGNLFYKNIKLENYSDLKLDYVAEHFN